jgi:diacylglycerol kinase family enzyme
MKRERTESRGVPRIFATAYALIQLYRRLPFHRIKVFVKGEETSHETPMLFFGNGYYDYDGLNIGERTLPIDRTLSLFILKSANRGTLFRMSIKALLNRIHNDSRFEKHFVEEAVIELQKKYIYVAKDGEIIKMESPLHYKIKPKSLRVIVPK